LARAFSPVHFARYIFFFVNKKKYVCCLYHKIGGKKYVGW
jgi:hypothetical protein